ncbi:hypothetical protein RSOL_306630, partial [Rhizoctonia solani AG-3 Rhs1AP]
MLTSLEVNYSLLRRTTVPFFQELTSLSELTLAGSADRNKDAVMETLWPAEEPVTRLELPRLRKLRIDAPPTYIQCLPLSASGAIYVSLVGFVSSDESSDGNPDDNLEGLDWWIKPKYSEEAWTHSIEAMGRIAPTVETLRLGLSPLCPAFVDRLSTFHSLRGVDIPIYVQESLVTYAEVHMPEYSWSWDGRSQG